MRAKFLLAALLTALTVNVAIANLSEQCSNSIDSETKLRACNEIIGSSVFDSNERAIAYQNRGDVRSNAGAFGAAIADYSQSLLLKPGLVTALAGRGLAKSSAGDLPGATADYDEAIRLSVPSANLHIERGYVHLAAGNVDASLADFTRALRLNPNSASAYNNRGLAFRKKGNLDRAYDDYSAAIAINPAYALAYANRGHLNEKQGRKADAMSDLKRALLLDPSLTAASEALVRLGSGQVIRQESAGRVRTGGLLAGEHCSGCHAIGREGTSRNKNAPEFRNIAHRHPLLALKEPITRGIAATHDEMPRFMLTDRQVDSIIAYINNLAAK